MAVVARQNFPVLTGDVLKDLREQLLVHRLELAVTEVASDLTDLEGCLMRERGFCLAHVGPALGFQDPRG